MDHMPRTLAEIMEASARGRGHSIGEYEVADLQHDWERTKGAAKPFMDFIPILLVTILENSVREVVARAVDHGQPYAARGLSMIARFRDRAIADTLLAFKEERITLGDLASHGFSTGRMDEIISALTTIFGDSFRDELAAIQTLWSEDEGQDLPPIITDLGVTIGCLDRLLQTRHILVHEQPRDKPYAEKDLPEFFSHTVEFISAVEWVLIGKLYSSVPRTQLAMNVQAKEKMDEAQAELDALRGGVSEDFADMKSPLAELEHHWDRYCDLSAQVRAGYISEDQPGSVAPLVYGIERARLTRWRIDEIRRLKSTPEGHL